MFNISYSFLSDIIKHGVLYAENKKLNRENKFNFGSAYHMFVLQPNKFKEVYTVFEGDKRTKAYKDLKEQVEEQYIIGVSDIEKMENMKKALLENPEMEFFMKMKKEVKFYKSIQDINWKAFLDFYDESESFGADLKTCGSVDPKEIARQCYKMNYDMQDYIYKNIACLNEFRFIFQETEYPYYSRIVKLDDEFYFNGEEKVLQAYNEYLKHTFIPEKTYKESCEISFSGYMRYEVETDHEAIKWDIAKTIQEKKDNASCKESITEDNKNASEVKKTGKITKGMLVEKFGKEETEKKIKNFLEKNNKSSWSVLTEDERVSIYEA